MEKEGNLVKVKEENEGNVVEVERGGDGVGKCDVRRQGVEGGRGMMMMREW